MNTGQKLIAMTAVVIAAVLVARCQDLSSEAKPLLVNYEETEAYIDTQSTTCTDCGLMGEGNTAPTRSLSDDQHLHQGLQRRQLLL